METPLVYDYYNGVEPASPQQEVVFNFAGYLESHTALAPVWLKMDDYQREEVLQYILESVEEVM